MLQILSRRFPGLHIRLFPALVQGEGSVEEVCRGIEYFSRTEWPDLVIVGRGGGSLEDLWTFNEEAVARAIAACSVPVVSAVGHETDVTIADFVADLRAPTPSAAAELVVPHARRLLDRIAAAQAKSLQAMRYRLAMLERRLRQQGIDRALGVLHRRVGRGLATHRRAGVPHAREHPRRHRRPRARPPRLEARLRRFDMRPRLAAGRRRLETAPTPPRCRPCACAWRAAAQRSRSARRQARPVEPAAHPGRAATPLSPTKRASSKTPPPPRPARASTCGWPKANWTRWWSSGYFASGGFASGGFASGGFASGGFCSFCSGPAETPGCRRGSAPGRLFG